MQESETNWYEKWFDTPYYHILYKDRDTEEAQFFIDNITQYLNLPENAKVLDLACGRGRHSVYLHSLGYQVLGTDLSENNIAYAKKYEKDSLHFAVQDMRKATDEKYDAIFNLFTSFGYFDKEEDRIHTLNAIKESLNETGFAVIDFMNVHKVLQNLVPEEIKTVEEIDFKIQRWQENGYIFKKINFEAQGEKYEFVERVKALTLQDFEELMDKVGIYLLDVFGDYKLHKYHKNESDRLIMIFK